MIAKSKFRLVRHTFAILSLILALLTITTILFCTDRTNKKYSLLILILVIVTMSWEVHFQLVLDPILSFFPAPCVARDDPLLNIPGSAWLHYSIFATLLALDGPALLACFIHRHQVVMPLDSHWRFSSKVQQIPTITFVLISLLIPPTLLSGVQPAGSVYRYVNMLSLPEELLARSDCFYPERLDTVVLWCSISSAIILTAIVAMAYHTFATLREQTALSEKSREFHRTMTKALIFQSGVPILIVILPVSLSNFAYYTNIDGISITSFCVTIVSAHSFIHSVAVLSTTPIYRKKLAMWLTFKNQKKLSTQISPFSQAPFTSSLG